MRKSKKIIVLLISLMLFGLVTVNKVYADPNSSKGFAEYNDEQAEQESQKMLEEQQKELKEAEGKSSNNYLENLKVEGYELSPKFDKQTIEYTIENTVNSSEINIVATPSDSKAKVEGAGKVKVDKNDFRIDVIAESGTVRTYTIHLTKGTNNNNEEPTNQEDQNKENDEMIEQPTEETSSVIQENGKIENNNVGNNENQSGNLTVWIIVFVVAVVIIATVLIVRSKNARGKHC